MTFPPTLPSPSGNLPSVVTDELPEIIHRAGANAVFAAKEFFSGTLRNPHTQRAYRHAVKLFLAWVEKHGGGDPLVGELTQIAPWHIGQYFSEMAKTTSIATRNQHLSALRHFFDGMVTRHAIVLNPALSVRGERYAVIEGKTPEIPIDQARKLLASIDTSHIVGLRDRAILAMLIYTGSRRGAVAKLKRGNFYHGGHQWMIHFGEKGGKSREIPVRHDLEKMIIEYLDAAGMRDAPKDTPLFQSALKKQRRLTGKGADIFENVSALEQGLKIDAYTGAEFHTLGYRIVK